MRSQNHCVANQAITTRAKNVGYPAVLSAPGKAYHFRFAPLIDASQGAPLTVLEEMEREEGEERVSGKLGKLESVAPDETKA